MSNIKKIQVMFLNYEDLAEEFHFGSLEAKIAQNTRVFFGGAGSPKGSPVNNLMSSMNDTFLYSSNLVRKPT